MCLVEHFYSKRTFNLHSFYVFLMHFFQHAGAGECDQVSKMLSCPPKTKEMRQNVQSDKRAAVQIKVIKTHSHTHRNDFCVNLCPHSISVPQQNVL